MHHRMWYNSKNTREIYKVRNCKLQGIYCERIQTRATQYTRSFERTCVHASLGRLQQKTRREMVHRRAATKFELRLLVPDTFFSPYARMPMGRYHCLIKFQNYFFSNSVYVCVDITISRYNYWLLFFFFLHITYIERVATYLSSICNCLKFLGTFLYMKIDSLKR